ncbi:MAG: hypothetical protein KY055_01875 [Candidatus Nealsonbacteria bacterium]|nr:hypothetical protein [Candidatus Nealsonbacteria bacterium]
MLAKIKEFVKDYQSDIILVIGVILISLFSFALGYIVAKQQEKEPIRIEFYESSHHWSGNNGPIFSLEIS